MLLLLGVGSVVALLKQRTFTGVTAAAMGEEVCRGRCKGCVLLRLEAEDDDNVVESAEDETNGRVLAAAVR